MSSVSSWFLFSGCKKATKGCMCVIRVEISGGFVSTRILTLTSWNSINTAAVSTESSVTKFCTLVILVRRTPRTIWITLTTYARSPMGNFPGTLVRSREMIGTKRNARFYGSSIDIKKTTKIDIRFVKNRSAIPAFLDSSRRAGYLERHFCVKIFSTML